MEAKTLALYLGCQVKTEFGKVGRLSGLDYHPGITTNIDIMYSDDLSDYDVLNDDPEDITRVKLLLRPLSSMTEEEGKEYAGLFFEDYNPDLTKFYNFGHCISIRYYDAFLHLPGAYEPKLFQYLLSKGFDLFGLIEKGEAIDSTKL